MMGSSQRQRGTLLHTHCTGSVTRNGTRNQQVAQVVYRRCPR